MAHRALDQLFREARSFSHWLDREVTDAQIHAIYELMKMAPTSANQQPARLVWCRSPMARQRLAAHASSGNKDKILTAPVCVIVAMDLHFHEQLPWLFPHTDARSWFTGDASVREESAFRNSSLQGAYLILAARALGLDCGPMSGFDSGAVDAEFFSAEPNWKSNFICAIGYGDRTRLRPRSPRPEFGAFNRVLQPDRQVRTLAIDCATEACSVALFDNQTLIAGTCEIIGRGHLERLVPMIAELPAQGRAERVLVSLGPGSFTGVRIGLAAARALGLAWKAEVLGYPTLALVAAIAREQRPGPVSVCVSAGHGEWFAQDFAADGFPQAELASLRPEGAAGVLRHSHVAGSQAAALVALRGHGDPLPLLPDARSLPLLPSALLSTSLAPLYGRAPDARLPVDLK